MRLILLIISLIISDCLIGQTLIEYNNKTDLEKHDLKGNVKSMLEMRSDLIFNDRDSVIVKNRAFYKFDINGKIIEYSDYYSNGELSFKHIYEYNEMGNITKDSLFHSEKRFCRKWIYKYDSNGKLAEDETFDYQGVSTKHIYQYDYKGNIIPKYPIRDPLDLIPLKKTIDRYDKIGNVIKLHYWNRNDKFATTIYYKYDENNNLIEESVYKEYGGTNLLYYTNDDKGNWIKKIDKLYDSKENFQDTTVYKRIIEYYD